jgi:hypothetical protein
MSFGFYREEAVSTVVLPTIVGAIVQICDLLEDGLPAIAAAAGFRTWCTPHS